MLFSATWQGLTLADSAGGDSIAGIRLGGVPVVQPLPGIRASAAGVALRRNVAHTLAFTNTRPPFSTPAAAAQFQADHAIAFLAITEAGTCEFTIGTRDYELRAAAVTRREVSGLIGMTVVYSYEITGGELVDVTPP